MHRRWTSRLAAGAPSWMSRGLRRRRPPAFAVAASSSSAGAATSRAIGGRDVGIPPLASRDEIERYANMAPTPLSLKQILEEGDPVRAAEFLRAEDPVRTAERISLMESIPRWSDVPELVEQHDRHVRAFSAIRSVDLDSSRRRRQREQNHSAANWPSLVAGSGRWARSRKPSPFQVGVESGGGSSTGGELDEFTNVVRSIVDENRDGIGLMSKALHRLYTHHYDPAAWRTVHEDFDGSSILNDGKTACRRMTFLDRLMDDFFLNRLGSNVLMHQYLALAGCPVDRTPSSGSLRHGIVDPECDVAELCRETARAVQGMYGEVTGMLPPAIKVEAYTAGGEGGEEAVGTGGGASSSSSSSPTFPFIPSALTYILQELLKNSCQATLVNGGRSGDYGDYVRGRPIKVVVSADRGRMLICVSDRAGGIPFEETSNVWSYLYTTSKRDLSSSSGRAGIGGNDDDAGTELSGYGVGLPLSRLYCRYFGGSLNLVSLPGYGTNAYIFLPRLSSELVEIVPDKDNETRPDWRAPMDKFVF